MSAARGFGWMRPLGAALAPLMAYFAASIVAIALTGDGLIGSIVGAVVAVVWMVLWRRARRKAEDPFVLPRELPGSTRAAWLTIAAFVVVFLVGQAAAQWWRYAIGSPGFEDRSYEDASVGLVVFSMLVVAPIGEEALMRGTVYPAMRRIVPAWAAAMIVSAVFALMHGNMVQAIATVPLGMLCAAVYERSGRVGAPIVVHVAFNVAAVMVPSAAINALAGPLFVVPGAVVLVILLALLFKEGSGGKASWTPPDGPPSFS